MSPLSQSSPSSNDPLRDLSQRNKSQTWTSRVRGGNVNEPLRRSNSLSRIVTNISEQEKIAEFNGLMDALNQVPEIKKTMEKFEFPKESIAFLVEELGKTQPEYWKESIQNLKNRIQESHKDPKKESVNITYLFESTVSQLYTMCLDNKIQAAQSNHRDQEVYYYQGVKEELLSSHELNFLIHSKGNRVSFVGVGKEFVPGWFHKLKS